MYLSTDTCLLTFDNVKVPAENLIGKTLLTQVESAYKF